MRLPLTKRLMLALSSHLTDPYTTHQELAKRFGVSRSAITMRIQRAKAKCEASGIALPERPRKLKGRNIRLAQLSTIREAA